MSSILFGESRAYTHNGDAELMEELGLRTRNFQRDWTDLGTVDLYKDGSATIKVEVSALPAQFFKFTITRPIEDPKINGTETIVIQTGSGGFGEYWEAAKMVANNCFVISEVVRNIQNERTQEGEQI